MRKTTLVAVAGCALGLAACGSSSTTPETATPGASSPSTSTVPDCVAGRTAASGSTALQPLVQKAAEGYMAKCSGATITVSGGGSSTGLSNVASAVSDIGDSDVPASNAKTIDPSTLADHQVAIVVFAVAVNAQTGVTALTSKQVEDIFSGAVTNWSQVGGKRLPVTLVERKPGSGTRLTFDSVFMHGTPESSSPASTQDSTQLVLQQVAGAPGGVSYLAASSIRDTSVIAASIDGAKPSADAVRDGSYGFFAHEHMYTTKTPPPLAASFINYVLSDAVQGSLVSQLGYLPVSTTTRQSAADR